MEFNENSVSYKRAKEMLDVLVANGGDVNNLKKGDKEYDYIKNLKAYDKNCAKIDLETRFKMLNHPRKAKHVKNAKEALIEEVITYKNSGGDFHIERKKLPFFERLHTYTRLLKKRNENTTHEQAMKGLGFKEYSDIYFRCKGLEKLKTYRDSNGYVDSYRNDSKMKAYIQDLSRTLNIPYYLIITLICNEKLKRCSIFTEYVENVKKRLQEYVAVNGSLKGIKRKDKELYESFNTLKKYYSDGTEAAFTKEEWLEVFEMQDVEHDFRDSKHDSIDITDIMLELKEEYQNKTIKLKDLDRQKYRLIIRKAISLGVSVSEVFNMYGLKCNGISVNRLSKMYVDEIPFLEEMKQCLNEHMKEKTIKNGFVKEEIFEIRVLKCKEIYNNYKQKIYNFTLEQKLEFEESN